MKLTQLEGKQTVRIKNPKIWNKHCEALISSEYSTIDTIPELWMLESAEKVNLAHPWADNYYHALFDWISDLAYITRYKPEAIVHPGYRVSQKILRDFEVSRTELYRYNFNNTDMHLYETTTILDPLRRSGKFRKSRLNWVRNKILPNTEAVSPKRKIIIVRRENAISEKACRNIIGIEDIRRIFRKNGNELEVHSMEELSVYEQAKLFNESCLIIASHGAALTNMAFCQSGTKVVEVVSPLFWNASYVYMSNYLNLNHIMIQAEADGNTIAKHDLKIDPMALLKATMQ